MKYASKSQGVPMFTERITVTIANEMHERLEEERKRRFLETIPDTVRMILSEYPSTHSPLTEKTAPENHEP